MVQNIRRVLVLFTFSTMLLSGCVSKTPDPALNTPVTATQIKERLPDRTFSQSNTGYPTDLLPFEQFLFDVIVEGPGGVVLNPPFVITGQKEAVVADGRRILAFATGSSGYSGHMNEVSTDLFLWRYDETEALGELSIGISWPHAEPRPRSGADISIQNAESHCFQSEVEQNRVISNPQKLTARLRSAPYKVLGIWVVPVTVRLKANTYEGQCYAQH